MRWLRGRTYQAELRVERLKGAWPDERTPAQQAAVKQAELFAASCRAALAHHQQLLFRELDEDAEDVAQGGIHPSEWSA